VKREYNLKLITKNNKKINEVKYFENFTEVEFYCNSKQYFIISSEINWGNTLLNGFYSMFSSDRKKDMLSDEILLLLLTLLKKAQRSNLSTEERSILLREYVENGTKYKQLKNEIILFNELMISGYQLDKALDSIGVPEYISSSIKVGIESGSIDIIYEKLINLLELKHATKKKVSKILLNPKISIAFLYAYFLFTIFYMIPSSKELTKMMDEKTFPEITKTFNMYSDWANDGNQIIFVLGTLFTLFVTYNLIFYSISKIIKYLPKLKDIYKSQNYTLIFSLLSVTVTARLSLHNSLYHAAQSLSDYELKQTLIKISNNIEKGKKIGEEFEKSGVFDFEVISEIKLGERTTELGESFGELSEIYKEKLEETIDTAMAFINPVVLVITAATLLTIYYAVNAPLLTFSGV
jgi:type II secretory pathway component PulF